MPKKTAAKAEPNSETTTAPVSKKEITKTGMQAEPVIEKQAYRVKSGLAATTYITVRNGFNGRLVYKSGKTGERFVWDGFGAEQDMEFQELKSARNSNKAYFESNWFLIDNADVIRELGVERFYKNALTFDGFEELFTKSTDEIRDIISNLSDGQRQSIAYRARQLIGDGTIDSIKTINMLEEALAVELIER